VTDPATDPAADLRQRLGRVGIWTPVLDTLPVADARTFATQLEQAGAGGVWYGEAYGREAFQQAGLLLADTSDLVVGPSIANIWGRDAMAARGAQAVLAALHPGRFVLGVGVSHAPLVERLRGHAYTSPLAHMRTWLQAYRDLQPVIVDTPPSGPVMVAALGPKMLELSAELADGALPYLTLPEHTAQARDILGPNKVLVVEAGAVLTGDQQTWQERAHRHLEIYTGLPNYRNSWFRQGFTEDDVPRGGSDRLKAAMVTHGMDATLERIREHLDAGADQVAVQVLGEHLADPALDDIKALLAEASGRV
jgi:probable F420-dependent oxidoreductase